MGSHGRCDHALPLLCSRGRRVHALLGVRYAVHENMGQGVHFLAERLCRDRLTTLTPHDCEAPRARKRILQERPTREACQRWGDEVEAVFEEIQHAEAQSDARLTRNGMQRVQALPAHGSRRCRRAPR